MATFASLLPLCAPCAARVAVRRARHGLLRVHAQVQPAQSTGLNKYSARITQPKSQGASQAMLYATGLKEEDMSKAQAGLAGAGRRAEESRCRRQVSRLQLRSHARPSSTVLHAVALRVLRGWPVANPDLGTRTHSLTRISPGGHLFRLVRGQQL